MQRTRRLSNRSTRFTLLLRLILLTALAAICASASALAQTNAAQPDPKAVPVIDGGIGPCTADFIITDASGAPVYAAKVNVHIAYGFASVRKLDLQVGTNIDGKARFTGLPDRIKHGIYFHASEGNRIGEAFDDPANSCKAQFTITLREKTQ
jgi:ABC-type Fe3+-hydroxamate transport system substrate-binding protein